MSFLRSGARWLGRFLLGRFGKLIATPIRRKLYAFEAATHHPQEVQQALLKRILEHQADSVEAVVAARTRLVASPAPMPR